MKIHIHQKADATEATVTMNGPFPNVTTARVLTAIAEVYPMQRHQVSFEADEDAMHTAFFGGGPEESFVDAVKRGYYPDPEPSLARIPLPERLEWAEDAQ